MKLLALFVCVACLVGANGQGTLTTAQKNAFTAAANIFDSVCKSILGKAIDYVMGTGKQGRVCGMSTFITNLMNPGTGCSNVVGNTNSLKVLIALNNTCELKLGCAGTTESVVSAVLQLLQCVLKGLGASLGNVSQLLQNITNALSGRGSQVVDIVKFIIFILLQKVADLLCDGGFSIAGISLVLPMAVGILLFGVIYGLLTSETTVLNPVGGLVLVLSPVILLVVIIVAILVLMLSPALDGVVLDLVRKLVLSVTTGTGVETCKPVASKLDIQKVLSLIDIGGIVKSLPTILMQALPLLGGLGLPGVPGLPGLPLPSLPGFPGGR